MPWEETGMPKLVNCGAWGTERPCCTWWEGGQATHMHMTKAGARLPALLLGDIRGWVSMWQR